MVQSKEQENKVKAAQAVKVDTKSAVEKPKDVAAVQSPDKPPKVAAGERAIWHKEHSYAGKNGRVITVRGHWEIIKTAPKPPVVVEKK